jgi:hypothetical protein
MALHFDKLVQMHDEVREEGPDAVKGQARTVNEGAILPRHEPGLPHNGPWVPIPPVNTSGGDLTSAGDPTRGKMSEGSNIVGGSDQGGEGKSHCLLHHFLHQFH